MHCFYAVFCAFGFVHRCPIRRNWGEKKWATETKQGLRREKLAILLIYLRGWDSTIPYLHYLLLGRVHRLLFNSDMKVYKVNLISFFLSAIGWLDGKLSEKMLLNNRKRNVDENLTPRKTGPYSLQIMIRKVNIPLTASQFKQRATLLRLIRFSHKDNFVLSVCKRQTDKDKDKQLLSQSYLLASLCEPAHHSLQQCEKAKICLM